MFDQMLPREHYAAFLEEIYKSLRDIKMTLQVQAEARGMGARSASQRERISRQYIQNFIPHIGTFFLPIQTQFTPIYSA